MVLGDGTFGRSEWKGGRSTQPSAPKEGNATKGIKGRDATLPLGGRSREVGSHKSYAPLYRFATDEGL